MLFLITGASSYQCRSDQRLPHFAAEGGIDHFIANVSALGTDDTPEGWRKAIDIDIVSTVESIRHAMPHLLKSGAKQPGATCTVFFAGSTIHHFLPWLVS